MLRGSRYLLLLALAIVVGFATGWYVRKQQRSQPAHQALYYIDPMHPSYHSARPGTAPDCGMELVPVYAEDAADHAVSADTSSTTKIDAAGRQLYGIQVEKAILDHGKVITHVFARVEADQTRIFHINFGTDGYVKETQNDAAGNLVTKDQRLAVVYSPDFLAVAGGYLAANERAPISSSTMNDAANANSSLGASSVQARADRLRNLGMSDTQIQEISRTKKLPEDIYVVSPVNGIILSRTISPGSRFERGSDLYTIADLSHIWINAEVFGLEANAFRPGTEVTATLADTGERFRAKVSDVLPEVDPATRTMKVRLDADNPKLKLRPGMYVNVELPLSVAAGVTVPVTAVLDSGNAKRVFIETAEGSFEPREVETGLQVGDRVQITKGVSAGDSVVSSGTFLVDSESRLQAQHNPLALSQ